MALTTTLDQQSRYTALYYLGVMTEAMAFCGLCDALAGKDYQTADEVETDESDLMMRFEALQGRDLPAEIHRQLSDLVLATSEVLRVQEVRLPRLADIRVDFLPASVLTYSLYDSDDRLNQVVALNPQQNPMLYPNEATVLIQRG
jgi:prophage DNA circulation protein